MELQLVFADSEVAAVVVDAGTVCVRFAAAHARRVVADGRPEEGWARQVELVFHGAGTVAAPGGFIGRLAEGRIGTAGQWASAVTLPGVHDGAVTVELAFANRSLLVFTAAGWACRFRGAPDFHESLAC